MTLHPSMACILVQGTAGRQGYWGGVDKVFAPQRTAKVAAQEKRQQDETIERLYAQVGRLTTQLDWLKKIWSYPSR